MRGRFFNTRTTYWMMARVVHLEDRCMTRAGYRMGKLFNISVGVLAH